METRSPWRFQDRCDVETRRVGLALVGCSLSRARRLGDRGTSRFVIRRGEDGDAGLWLMVSGGCHCTCVVRLGGLYDGEDRDGRVKCDVMSRLVLALHVMGTSKGLGDRIVEGVLVVWHTLALQANAVHAIRETRLYIQ